jgi:hypothetical protein
LSFVIGSANQGSTMAKRKKQSAKVQKRKGAKARPKAKKLSKATRGKAAAKRAVARAKPKRAPMKKAARPVAPAIETVVEVIEQPAPAVTTVTEVEETELRQASWIGGMLVSTRQRGIAALAKATVPASCQPYADFPALLKIAQPRAARLYTVTRLVALDGLGQELGLIIPHELEKPIAASALFFTSLLWKFLF